MGCASDIDVNSDEVKALANLALSALENIANAEKVQSVARIVKASSQVRRVFKEIRNISINFVEILMNRLSAVVCTF